MSSVQCLLSSVQCPVSSVYCLVSIVQCPVSSVQPSAQCPVPSVQCPVSSVQYPVSSVQCPVSSVQCPVSTPHTDQHTSLRSPAATLALNRKLNQWELNMLLSRYLKLSKYFIATISTLLKYNKNHLHFYKDESKLFVIKLLLNCYCDNNKAKIYLSTIQLTVYLTTL